MICRLRKRNEIVKFDMSFAFATGVPAGAPQPQEEHLVASPPGCGYKKEKLCQSQSSTWKATISNTRLFSKYLSIFLTIERDFLRGVFLVGGPTNPPPIDILCFCLSIFYATPLWMEFTRRPARSRHNLPPETNGCQTWHPATLPPAYCHYFSVSGPASIKGT